MTNAKKKQGTVSVAHAIEDNQPADTLKVQFKRYFPPLIMELYCPPSFFTPPLK